MWSIIRESLTYLCFLILLCIITYSNDRSSAYFQVNHLRKYFLNSTDIRTDEIPISTVHEYWNWLEGSFVEKIRAQQWYNGDTPRNLAGFIDDKNNRLIGWSTMRQLRIKSSLCSYRKLRSDCVDDYDPSKEEKDSFAPGWINETSEEFSSTIRQAFRYQSSEQLDTYVVVGRHGSYSGNGYVYEFRGRLNDLRSNLSRLHQLQWIDSRTRAVIIQFTLYNPNVQLFSSVTILTEFLSTTAIYLTARFETMDFQGILTCFPTIEMESFVLSFSLFIETSTDLYDLLHDLHSLFHVD